MGTLLIGKEGFVHFFAVADADDLDFVTGMEQLRHRLGQHPDGAGGSLLYQDIPAGAVLKSEEHQVNGLLQGHDEPGHVRLGDGNGAAGFDLVNPQRDHASPGAHDVAVAGAADFGILRVNRPGLGHNDLLHHGLGGAHGVHRVGRLVGRQADHRLDPLVNGRGEHVIRADDVGLHRLHGEKLAGGHLLQSRRVENVVHIVDGVFHGLQIPDVADEELDFCRGLGHFRLELVAHVVLLLFVPGENPDLADVRIQEPVQHRVAEGTGAAGDHQGLARKDTHGFVSPSCPRSA